MKNYYQKFKNRGFTMIEILLYIALLSMFLIILTSIFVSILDVKEDSESTSFIDQDSRYILARLSYDIRRSATIDTSQANLLSLTIGGSNYSYSLVNNNLILSNPEGAFQLNNSFTKIDSISFVKVTNPLLPNPKDTVRIQAQLSSLIEENNGQETRQIITTVGKR